MKKKTLWITGTSVLVVLIAVIVFLALKNTSSDEIVIINDKRCADCRVQHIVRKLQYDFPGLAVKQLDYMDSEGQALYNKLGLDKLPAILLSKKAQAAPAYTRLMRFTVPKGDYRLIRIGAKFDPKAEICNNSIDDDKNGQTDCEDQACKTDWLCMEKRNKPSVNIFVMSHCPFGTQIEKGIYPVWKLLGNKANINLRFCSYAMHGKKELDEQLTQTCIHDKQPKKFLDYLHCFLEKDDSKACLKKAKINKSKLTKCIKALDKKFNVSKNYKDKSTWMGRFPTFNVHGDLNKKYAVRGSPTVVINDVIAKVGRSPKELLKAICLGFKNPPKECKQPLSDKAPAPGFGWKDSGSAAAQASCGG